MCAVETGYPCFVSAGGLRVHCATWFQPAACQRVVGFCLAMGLCWCNSTGSSGGYSDTLGSVPNLLMHFFELDISLLVHQPLNYISVTLTAALASLAPPSGWLSPPQGTLAFGKLHTLTPLKTWSYITATPVKFAPLATSMGVPVRTLPSLIALSPPGRFDYVMMPSVKLCLSLTVPILAS